MFRENYNIDGTSKQTHYTSKLATILLREQVLIFALHKMRENCTCGPTGYGQLQMVLILTFLIRNKNKRLHIWSCCNIYVHFGPKQYSFGTKTAHKFNIKCDNMPHMRHFFFFLDKIKKQVYEDQLILLCTNPCYVGTQLQFPPEDAD